EQDGNMQFWGSSFIANPIGKVLYQSSMNEADTPVIPINLDEIGFYRVHWPFLRDRRIDSYAPILNRAIDK
ncbi:MAG: acyltransferase, partial [Sediminibacterium sp.]|nr:acyltransferase [Sediminibacterium sp.]